MGDTTKISWATHTFNGWIGCERVGRGCQHCYAEAFTKYTGKAKWGPAGTRVVTTPAYWRKPLKWNADAKAAGKMATVFAFSMADFFEDWTGPITNNAKHGWTWRWESMQDVRLAVFKSLIDATPWLLWLILTKRPQNIRPFWPLDDAEPTPIFPGMPGPLGQPQPCVARFRRPNVMLGCSVTTQAEAERYVPELIACRSLCAGIFVSNEPAVKPIDWTRAGALTYDGRAWRKQINALIVGGESGPHREAMDIDCVECAAAACDAGGIALFVKQDSALREGQQGRIRDDLWARKEWPDIRPVEAQCRTT